LNDTAMDEGDDFYYNGLDGVVFDEEIAESPEQGLEEPQTGEVLVSTATEARAYGSDYESDDQTTRSPAKKPKTDTGRSGRGRKKGSTSSRLVHVPPLPHLPKLGLKVRFFGDDDGKVEECDAEELAKHLSRAHDEGARSPAPEAGSEQLTAPPKAQAAATAKEEDEENKGGD